MTIIYPIDFYLKTSDTQKYISLNREQKQFNLVSLRTKRPGQETGLEKKEGPKGQMISKRLLVSSDSSKKRTNEFGFFCLTVLKTNLFVRFLEESENTKKSFRNYLTFTYQNHCSFKLFLCKTGL